MGDVKDIFRCVVKTGAKPRPLYDEIAMLQTPASTTPRRRGRKADRGRRELGAPTRTGLGLPLTVLVVDDLADAREMYKRFLEFRGLRVLTASDGEAALVAIEQHRPDAIVIDLAMPRL